MVRPTARKQDDSGHVHSTPLPPPPPPQPPYTHVYSTHLGRVVSELTVTHREHAGTVIGLSPTDRK